MSANNGVIRIGRKGIKKFAFGEDGAPFDVDVVVAFQRWIEIDDAFRQESNSGMDRLIPLADVPAFHKAAVEFAEEVRKQGTRSGVSAADTNKITTAEALDFIARLREQYDELAGFFQPKSLEGRVSPGTLEAASEFRFSEEK